MWRAVLHPNTKGVLMYTRFTLTASLFIWTQICTAEVTQTYNKSLWQQTVQNWTTIDFTGWPQFTHIYDQYASQWVVFADDNEYTVTSPLAFPNDSHGLNSNDGFIPGQITCQFDRDMYWVAVDHPTDIRIHLYLHGRLTFTSNIFIGSTNNRFAGLISSEPFDTAVIQRTVNSSVAIDDLFFGTIPAPGTLPLLAALLFSSQRRRK
jgi:hypothetical protein